MQEEGYIAAILYPEGTKDLPLGSALAILVEDQEDVAKFADYKLEASSSSAPKQEPAAAAAPVETKEAPVAAAP